MSLKIKAASPNPTVGNLTRNRQAIQDLFLQARRENVDILVTPEMSLTGYPLEDLVAQADFLPAVRFHLEALAQACAEGPALLVGAPVPGQTPGQIPGRDRPYNAVHLLEHGRVKDTIAKQVLPNYGVFDEKRQFEPGPPCGPVDIRGVRFGLLVCEDMWDPEPVATYAESGAQVLIALNASPFEHDKLLQRQASAARCARRGQMALLYVNLVGGQDSLVFDGGNFAVDAQGRLTFQAPQFETGSQLVHLGADSCFRGELHPPMESLAALWAAMVLSLQDYVAKTGFERVVLGLSGGVDSALVLVLLVDALGPNRVQPLALPSAYNAPSSLEDARQLCQNLGVRLEVLPIEAAYRTHKAFLAQHFEAPLTSLADQNLQARLRALYLMAWANQYEALLIATSNKSEVAVGYTTLYGDMSGAYNPIKDLYKTQVYELAQWRNLGRNVVLPPSILSKAPSAELKPDQTDQETLPSYPVLDAVLKGWLEDNTPLKDFPDAGLARDVWRKITQNEHKRAQSPPGPKLSGRDLDLDRRFPRICHFEPD